MSAPVLNGPFVLPMFRSFRAAEDATVDFIFFIAVTFQLSGGCLFGCIESDDRQHVTDAGGYFNVHVRQPGRYGDLLSVTVPHEVSFYQ